VTDVAVTRITQRAIADTALRGLQGNLSRVQQLQEQLSSGRRIQRPSDDPSGAVSAMTFRSQRAASEQHLRNIEQATGRLGMTDDALTSLSDRLRAVREHMVQSRSGAINSEGRSALAAQISSIRGEVVDLYNTRYLDRPVFGGTAPGSFAVDPATGAYVGDDATVATRISRDATVRVDVKGSDVGADGVPALLARIAANVSTSGATAADYDELDAAMSKVLQALGDVGARAARVETTKAAVDSTRLDLTSRISESEDVDLPETIMNLQAQQVAYQAALGAAAKIQQISLVDFLR
jgi:flagellar hook-associated protein 3 FlgL